MSTNTKITAISAFQDNYIWAIPLDARRFACVDPGDAIPVLNYAQAHGLSLDTVLVTHHHADHIGGLADLKRAYPDLRIIAPADPRIRPCTEIAQTDQPVLVSPWQFEVLFIPGHTSTHIAYYEPRQGWLFCGDTLFSGGCGRVFDGTLEQLFASLMQLAQLPDSTQVFCAHEYTRSNLRFARTVEPGNSLLRDYADQIAAQALTLPSTMGLEKQINPFLRLSEPAVRHWAAQQDGGAGTDFEIFKLLRACKNRF